MALPVAILIVLGAAAAGALLLILVRLTVRAPVILDSGRARAVTDVTGTLFAVLLAFVILAAFGTYDNAKSGAATEANALLDMARTAALFPATQRDALRSDFICYGRAVVADEWPAMRQGHSSPFVDNWVSVYRGEFGRLSVRSLRAQAAFQNLLTEAATRTSGRQQRLGEASPAVPTPLWIALVFGGCVTVLLLLGMADPRERLAAQSALIAGVASLVAAGLLMVYFLDHPYQSHTGGIQPRAMRHTLVLLRNLEPALRPGCGQSGRPY